MNPEFAGLNLVDLINLLEPVPEPPPISMMPQTAGWIWLGLVLIALLALVTTRLVHKHRSNAYRRAALKELEVAQDQPDRIAAILRRTALAAFPRGDVAGLIGQDWLCFLDDSFPGTGFETGAGQVLATAPYKSAGSDPSVTALARDWVRRHTSGNR